MVVVVSARDRWDLILLACGAKKQTCPVPAGELYTGAYFQACRQVALNLPHDQMRIVSARHGLLRLQEMVAPYDQRLGQPGAVTSADLYQQAVAQQLLGARTVLVLGGQAYVAIVRSVWPRVEHPLHGGIGQQLAQLRAWRGRGVAPTDFEWQ
ncbi:MAG TPA: hypothetical protein VKE26_26205 [Xanthobacteraceae bacterium]|nr:hypothetical protein [Xanthobacteraceae bacterium]